MTSGRGDSCLGPRASVQDRNGFWGATGLVSRRGGAAMTEHDGGDPTSSRGSGSYPALNGAAVPEAEGLLDVVRVEEGVALDFEPAFETWPLVLWAPCFDTLRHAKGVEEVFLAKVKLPDSERSAKDVLVVASKYRIDAAEAHAALGAALAAADCNETCLVWYLRSDSPRLAQLRAAGCLALRREKPMAPDVWDDLSLVLSARGGASSSDGRPNPMDVHRQALRSD